MTLPPLPKQNKKMEADFGIRFRRWWERHGMDAGYELKDSRGKDSINFSEVSEDQITIGLLTNSDKGVLIRVENGTIGAQDYIGMKNKPSFIVIKYPKSAEVIPIANLMYEKERYKRKSLTYERAKAISVTTIT